MAFAISLLTITTVSFLVATFMHNFSAGLFWASLLHIVHFMIFGAGYILPISQVWVNYFFSALVAAVAGWIFAILLRIPALLNGAYYGQVFTEEFATKKGITPAPDSSERWKAFGKFILTLLIVAAGHIIYELNVSGFPKWAGSLFVVVLDIVAWIVFYWLFRDSENQPSILFNSAEPNNEIKTISFNIAAAQLVFALPYLLFQIIDCTSWSENYPLIYTGGECVMFYQDQWYFYVSLISGGAVLVWAAVVGIYARGYEKRAEYAPMPSEYRMRKGLVV